MTRFVWAILVYCLTYLVLTSNFEVLNIGVGLLLATVVAILVPPTPLPLTVRSTPHAIRGAARYVLVLIKDLVVSGVVTARLVLTPSLPIEPGIVEIATKYETELGAALGAHAITLTPGELVVELDEDYEMFTHSLNARETAESAAEVQDKRYAMLNDIFP